MAQRGTLAILFVLLALPVGAEESTSPGDTNAPASQSPETPSPRTALSESGNRKATRGRSAMRAGLDGHPRDSLSRGLGWLQEHGLLLNLDVALLDQYASKVNETPHNATTYAWSLFGEYQVFTFRNAGSLTITANLLGSVGLGYDTAVDPISARTGTISFLDANIYPNGIGLDQIYLQYISENAGFSIVLGKIDTSDFFDANGVAGDAFREFFAFTFENGLSVPYPTYGGVGALVRWKPTKETYVLAAVSDATSDDRVRLRSMLDGAWWELLEVGVTTQVGSLGQGTYRLTAWQSNVGQGSGEGISLNVEQNLGRDDLVSFLRLGTGSRAQTAVHAAVSGGFSWQSPWNRKNDQAGLGVSWADASSSSRDEILIEGYYRYTLTPRLSLSPDLQIVVNPVAGPQTDVVVVGGLRLTWTS